jgi:hypothetical protein
MEEALGEEVEAWLQGRLPLPLAQVCLGFIFALLLIDMQQPIQVILLAQQACLADFCSQCQHQMLSTNDFLCVPSAFAHWDLMTRWSVK